MEKNQWMRAAKIAVGCAMAILISEALHLQFSTAAGIITLLTIQDTKKETLRLSLKRLVSFLITILICIIFFGMAGRTHWAAFTIVIFLVVSFVLYFHWEDTLSVNAVVCTHFMGIQQISPQSVVNELALVTVGTVIAILLNLFVIKDEKNMRQIILRIERHMQVIMRTLAMHLKDFNQSDSVSPDIDLLESYLEQARKHAFENENNNFHKAAGYYAEYTQMRFSQSSVLRNLQTSLRSLTFLPPQAKLITPFMEHLADSFHEQNNMASMLEELEEIFQRMKLQPQPVSREEFENRAILFHILLELKEFLEIKKHFCDDLSQEEIDRYWGAVQPTPPR